jgi:hypothetical protein
VEQRFSAAILDLLFEREQLQPRRSSRKKRTAASKAAEKLPFEGDREGHDFNRAVKSSGTDRCFSA